MVNAIYRQANMSFLAEKIARMSGKLLGCRPLEVASNSESKRVYGNSTHLLSLAKSR